MNSDLVPLGTYEMLKEMLSAAIAAALIAGAVPPAAAGPTCPGARLDIGMANHRDLQRPHVDALEPGSRRLPIEVSRTEADGSVSTVYIDPRSFAPVLPGMLGCLIAP